MVTFNEVVAQAKEEVDIVYGNADRQQIKIDMDNIIAELNWTGVSWKVFQQYTPDELSRMWGRLAVLRASLIHYKSEAFRQIKISEQFAFVKEAGLRGSVKTYLTNEAKAKGEKAPSVEDIKIELARQMAKINLIKELHNVEYEKVQSYWYSIPDILYRIEQRINVLVGDKSTSKFMKDSDDVIPDLSQAHATSYDEALADVNVEE